MKIYLLAANENDDRRVRYLLAGATPEADIVSCPLEPREEAIDAASEPCTLVVPLPPDTSIDVALRAVERAASPVLVLDPHPSDNRDATFLNAGADDYLPLDGLTPSELRRALRHALHRFRRTCLRQRETEALKRVVETTEAALLLVDADGRILQANEVLTMKMGASTEDGRTLSLRELLSPGDVQKVRNGIECLVTGEEDRVCLEARFRTRDRGTLWTRLSLAAVRDENGTFRHALGLVEDISDRRRAENEVEYLLSGAQCILWRATVERQGDTFVWDLHMINEYAAQRFLPLHVPPGGSYREAWEAAKLPEDIERTRAKAHEALHPIKSRYTQEFRVRDRFGNLRWLSEDVFAEPIGKHRWYLIGVCTDITERKLAETQIHRQALAFENIADAIILTDLHATIVEWNPAAEHTFGYSRREAIGMSATTFFDPAEAATMSNAVWRAIHRDGKWEGEHELVRKDGSRILCELTVVPLVDENEKPMAIVTVVRDVTDRKQAERELRESRARLQLLSEIATGVTSEMSVEAIIEHALVRIHRHFSAYRVGYGTLDETMHLKAYGWVGDDGRLVRTGLEADLRGEPAFARALCDERQFICADVVDDPRIARHVDMFLDSGVRSLLAVTLPHGDQQAGFLLFFSPTPTAWTSHERTALTEVADYLALAIADAVLRERHARTERALRATGARFQTMFASSPFGILISDEYGRPLDANPAAESILGYSVEELTHMDGEALVQGEEVEKTVAGYDRVWRELDPEFRGELRLLAKDGSVLWARLVTTLMRDEEGKPAFFLTIFEDVTERKAAERALRESEERYRDLFENANDLIQSITPNGRFLYVNRAWKEALGYSDDEIGELSLFDIIHPEGLSAWTDTFQQVLAGEPVGVVDIDLVAKDGHVISVEGDFSCRIEEGKPISARAIFRDVTERKRIERMKNEFISTVSHELRTPLTSIQGSLDLLIGGAAGTLTPDTHELVRIAHSNSTRLVRLINDILDIEKIESGKIAFALRPTALTPLIRQAITVNEAYADQFDVTLQLDENLPDIVVHVDGDRLIQVLTNLLSNAAKFSPSGAEVRVSVERQDDWVRVSVADQGPGIPEDLRETIFERFTQADASNTRAQGGTGLGLSISRTIIDKLGGRIGFDTELGVGSTFYFELPIWKPTEIAPVEEWRPERPRILICEADPSIADRLEWVLRAEDFDTDVADSAARARELLATRRYEAMTLDLILPDERGISFIRALRERPETRRLPIVVVSVAAEESVPGSLNGYALEIVDWIDTPSDRDRLVRAVKTAVETRDVERPTILHIEDDHGVRTLVAAILRDVADVVPATGVADAEPLLDERRFDLVLLDLRLPDGSGMDLLPRLRRVPVVIFSVDDVAEEVNRQVAAALVKSRTSNVLLRETIQRLISRWEPRLPVVSIEGQVPKVEGTNHAPGE